MQLAPRFQTGIIAVAVASSVLLGGCAAQRPTATAPASAANQAQPSTSDGATLATAPGTPELLSVSPRSPSSGKAYRLPGLPAPAQDTGGSGNAVVVPESGFVDTPSRGIVQDAPPAYALPDSNIGALLAHAGDSEYTGGLGWAPGGDADQFKLSVLRQQALNSDFEGRWLASAKGGFVAGPPGHKFNLEGELAMLAGEAGGPENTMGGRLRLTRPLNKGLTYELTLSHFGDDFAPNGSLVNTGTDGVHADFNYDMGADMRLTADIDYTRKHALDIARCELRTRLALTGGDYLQPFDGKLETSMLRSRVCGAGEQRHLSHWKLSLTEETWSGWNLHLAMAATRELPSWGDASKKQLYRLESRREWRLGNFYAVIGPTVSLQLVDGATSERRLKTGLLLSMDAFVQHLSLRMAYESYSINQEFADNSLDIKMAYELDLDV